MVPNGWEVKHLSELASKVSDGIHKTPLYAESSGVYFINGNNLKNGSIVIQDSTNFVDENDAENHRKDLGERTILMSINGTIGNLAYYRGENVVLGKSAAYINVKNSVDLDFVYYVLSSSKTQAFYESELTGTTIRNLSIKSIKNTKVDTPPLPEQKKIAQILSTWDRAISTTEQLLANSQQQKKALMQQLLTGKKRLLDSNGVKFQGEWHRTELGELLDYKQPTPYLVESTEYRDEYKTPVLTAGKTFILGYTDETSGIYQEKLPVIIFDDFTTDSKFVDFPFKAKSSAMKILVAKKGVSIKYVFEAMQMLNFAVGGHQRHWISIFSNLVIPVPSKEEQERIASVLSAADQEIQTLQSQLDALKQEKKALMQQLLTGKRRVQP
ncbi:restriction endonuclease subunit S [Aeromonas sp. L_1B5_3]|uniref:restriction endonuclease subunit S n=1 Tax=Aeromonas sp. L_1B5_3 TaxID=1588629 RepID=UPI0005B6E3F8|nr:restriction endonuclease subunit S [Aeromonas sp. L_1B5_3]KIQ80940.1 hypothetical protein RW26_10305 [Aeromonas sp. L_1B5_3]